MFGTPQQLQILKHARRWICDDTFKITPEPFEQTWSIHAFINIGDSYKQVPLVFCLMSQRKTVDYNAIFERLIDVIDGDLGVQAFVVDFEKGRHTRINKDLGRAHQSFYVVVPALRREANLVTLTYRLVSEEQMLRDQRNRRKETEGRLHQLWKQYDEGSTTASQLLADCSKYYGLLGTRN